MSTNLNQCCFIGNVAGDPRYEEAGDKGSSRLFFDLAVNGRTKRGDEWVKTVDYIPVLLRGAMADAGADHIGKGKQLVVVGTLVTRRKNNDDGSYTKSFFISCSQCNYGPDSAKTRAEATGLGEVDIDEA